MGEDGVPREELAVEAARRAARAAGLRATDAPDFLGVTNNVVLALDEAVVAKVGTWPHSRVVLSREFRVASLLKAAGAPVVPPLTGSGVFEDLPTGYTVTLWTRVAAATNRGVPDAGIVADRLHVLHAALDTIDLADAPSFLWGLDLAAATLRSDSSMVAMTEGDLRFLRATYRDLLARTRARVTGTGRRLLHGEPHGGNVLLADEGPTFLDFEGVCVGPVEWDLASVEPAVVADYPGPVDADLLAMLTRLNRARVAIWCWAGADRSDMRWHAEHHLGYLRDAPV